MFSTPAGGSTSQALEVLRKLAASSDANLGALRAASALGALLELLAAAPPASGRAAGAVHLLRDLALYAPASRCASHGRAGFAMKKLSSWAHACVEIARRAAWRSATGVLERRRKIRIP